MSRDDSDDRNRSAWWVLSKILKEVERMEVEGYSYNDIAAHITWRLHGEGLTMQQFEDWRNRIRD